MFPEINLDKMEFHQGMNISVVIRNSGAVKSLEMLRKMGMPFKAGELHRKAAS